MELMVSPRKLLAHLFSDFLYNKITGERLFGLNFACNYRLSWYID